MIDFSYHEPLILGGVKLSHIVVSILRIVFSHQTNRIFQGHGKVASETVGFQATGLNNFIRLMENLG